MLFVSIAKPELMQQIPAQVDGVELRLDLFPCIDLEFIHKALQNSAHSMMLTIRKASHGGGFLGSESERETLIKQLLSFEPDFFDLEYDMREGFLDEVSKRYPKTKFILSYHNFRETPVDLEVLYHLMVRYPAFSYKIAVMTSSTIDALRMLVFSKKHPNVSAICMGEKGQFARVLGPVVGNLINYASFDEKQQIAPGQLTVAELMSIYHYPLLNMQTAIYGLIGNPVINSVGHLYHNDLFRKHHLNAVYVKMTVEPEELTEFVFLSKQLGLQGLSVTMPLKEAVLPFVDEIDPSARQIGAVNTLLFKNEKIFGINTDGIGALDALEQKCFVRGKNVVLIGAGGAARSIAFEAKERGANVLILNRTIQRANKLAVDIEGCSFGGLDDLPENYDLLVNCSPDPMPIDPKKINEGTVAMDIVYHPRKTMFLEEASLKKCQIVYGEEMFLNQAARQFSFWMKSKLKMTPLKEPLIATVCMPGSKSYTNRALIMAALTKTPVSLKNPLYSDDTEAMIGCLRALGLKIETNSDQIIVHDHIGSIGDRNYQLFAHDSGTTVRFMLALLCIVPGIKIIQGSKRLNERPIKDLVDGLRQLGAYIEYEEEEGQLPVKVSSSTLSGDYVHLKGDISSQFCSAILLISPYISKGLTIDMAGSLISKSYVEMTISCMQSWGVNVIASEDKGYFVPGHQSYRQQESVIEGDFSSAGYFFAIAVLTKSTITLGNLPFSSIQADRKFLTILAQMGNIVSYEANQICIQGKQILPMEVDMEDCPDQVMTMAVLAMFAKGVTKISGVRSLRVKETERVVALKNELKKMGIHAEDTYDTLTIYGGDPNGAEIDTYNDHRMAMAFAVAGMHLDGVTICHPEVVNKTFPTFWEVLRSLK